METLPNKPISVLIKILDATEINNSKRKRKKVHIGKVLNVSNGCTYEIISNGGLYSHTERRFVGLLDGDSYSGINGTDIFHITDIRHQLKKLFLSTTTGTFPIPLAITVNDMPGTAFNTDLIEIMAYSFPPESH